MTKGEGGSSDQQSKVNIDTLVEGEPLVSRVTAKGLEEVLNQAKTSSRKHASAFTLQANASLGTDNSVATKETCSRLETALTFEADKEIGAEKHKRGKSETIANEQFCDDYYTGGKSGLGPKSLGLCEFHFTNKGWGSQGQAQALMAKLSPGKFRAFLARRRGHNRVSKT